MTSFDVAHFSQQGQQIVVVFVSRTFGHKTNVAQNEVRDSLQACAAQAGLAGTVVPVWDAGGGKMGFLAPGPWRNFFKGLNLATLARNVNRKLTCG